MNRLPVVPYAEWLVKLENAAVRPTKDDLNSIVSSVPICLLLTVTLKGRCLARHHPSALIPQHSLCDSSRSQGRRCSERQPTIP